MKEAGLADRLRYDDHERRSALVRFLRQDVSPDAWAAAASADLGDAVDRSYDVVELGPRRLVARRDAEVAGGRIRVTKTIQLGGGRLDPTLEVDISVENLGPNGLETRLGIESTTTMLGGGGNPSAWWDVAGTRASHDGSGCAAGVTTLSQGNAYIGIEIDDRDLGPGRRLVGPSRDDLELRERASSACTRAAGCSSRGR